MYLTKYHVIVLLLMLLLLLQCALHFRILKMVVWTTATKNERLGQQLHIFVNRCLLQMVMQNDSVKLIQRGLDQLLNVQVSTVPVVCDVKLCKLYVDIRSLLMATYQCGFSLMFGLLVQFQFIQATDSNCWFSCSFNYTSKKGQYWYILLVLVNCHFG